MIPTTLHTTVLLFERNQDPHTVSHQSSVRCMHHHSDSKSSRSTTGTQQPKEIEIQRAEKLKSCHAFSTKIKRDKDPSQMLY